MWHHGSLQVGSAAATRTVGGRSWPDPSTRARVNKVSTKAMRTNAAPQPTEIAFADGWNTCS